MARAPKGIIAVNRADALISQRMGNWMTYTAPGGTLAYIECYNNSNSGQYLYVTNLNVVVSGNAESVWELYQGTYTTVAPLLPSAPVSPLAAVGPGVYGAHNKTFCIGTHIGGIGNAANSTWTWPYNYPVCAVPPGWSFAVQAALPGAYMMVAMQWVYDAAP